MGELENLHIGIQEYSTTSFNLQYDLDGIIYDLNNNINLLSSQADKFDYLLSTASGLMCGQCWINWKEKHYFTIS